MADREAMFQTAEQDGRVRCGLCPHRCLLGPGAPGLCGARWNHAGTLRSAVHRRVAALQDDPVEKKPLYHLLPGSRTLSLATCGCNLRCDFCQNHTLSQTRPAGSGRTAPGELADPDRLAELAVDRGCASVAFTYSEPTVFYEFAREVGTAARARGLLNLFVTNGMITPEAVDDAAATFLDAANVDLKAFREEFYRRHCHGSLAAVQAALVRMLERGIWVEVTTLVIPGRNDGDAELDAAARWLASLSPDLPWHLSRFHPDHRATGIPPTSPERLRSARQIGLAAGLRHVYLGNLDAEEGNDTRCAACGALLVRRRGFRADPTGLRAGRCAACGAAPAGRW